jgi:hypothetical protein
MEVAATFIEFKDTFKLIPLFDMHIGAAACDENKLDRTIKQILDTPDCYTIIGGDMADAILRQDFKRYMHGCANQEISDALDDALNITTRQVIDKLKALAEAGKILGVMSGNHEISMQKHHSYNLTRAVCEGLNSISDTHIPQLGYSCLYRITLKSADTSTKRNWVLYAHHGFGGGRKKGSSINNLIGLQESIEADCYIMGHDHKKIATRGTRLSITGRGEPRLVAKSVAFVRAGTFLKSYLDGGKVTYSEQAGYPPVPTGSVKIEVSMGRRDGQDQRELETRVQE